MRNAVEAGHQRIALGEPVERGAEGLPMMLPYSLFSKKTTITWRNEGALFAGAAETDPAKLAAANTAASSATTRRLIWSEVCAR